MCSEMCQQKTTLTLGGELLITGIKRRSEMKTTLTLVFSLSTQNLLVLKIHVLRLHFTGL